MNARRIGQHVHKFSEMDVGELSLFLRAWLILSGWWIRVRVGAIPDSLATQSARAASSPTMDSIQPLIKSCQLAAHRAENYHFLRANCLLRSLTLQSLLRSRGVASRLCLGIRPDTDQAIEAHAWLEVGEMTLGRRIPGEPEYDQLNRSA